MSIASSVARSVASPVASSVAVSGDIPANALRFNGMPVKLNGQFVIFEVAE